MPHALRTLCRLAALPAGRKLVRARASRWPWRRLQRAALTRLPRPIAAVLATVALAGCSLQDCAYYGGADASVRCVVVGPAPTGGGH